MAWVRLLLLMLIGRPVARFLTGADVIGRERLPTKGPAIVVANHNSHVDTLLMMALFSPSALMRVRPAAAADYFLSGPMIGWFSRHVIGIVPVERATPRRGSQAGADVLGPSREALAAGDIILIFPEGTRGAPGDQMAPLKSGVARLAAAAPDAPITPVWIQGAGRVLAKGDRLPVPMTCCAVVGEPIRWSGDRSGFMNELKAALEALKAQAPPLRWSEAGSADRVRAED
jgi:1-acyl-sn-glycerol-3-phosphate acyltransferase